MRLLLLCALLATPLTAQRVERRLPLDADGMVKLFIGDGTLTVVGWDRDSVVITGTVEAPGTLFFGGGRRGVKGGVEGSPLAQLEVRVPRRARLSVRAGEGSILVRGVTGPLDASSTTGDVTLEATSPEVQAETMGGTLRITASPDYLRARTATGRLEWTGSGADAQLTSVSGRISVRAGTVRRLRVESVSGDLAFDGALDAGGSLTLESHAGDIDVVVPRRTAATCEVAAASGDVLGTRFVASVNRPDRGSLSTSIGGSDAGDLGNITVRTFKGRATVRTRP